VSEGLADIDRQLEELGVGPERVGAIRADVANGAARQLDEVDGELERLAADLEDTEALIAQAAASVPSVAAGVAPPPAEPTEAPAEAEPEASEPAAQAAAVAHGLSEDDLFGDDVGERGSAPPSEEGGLADLFDDDESIAAEEGAAPVSLADELETDQGEPAAASSEAQQPASDEEPSEEVIELDDFEMLVDDDALAASGDDDAPEQPSFADEPEDQVEATVVESVDDIQAQLAAELEAQGGEGEGEAAEGEAAEGEATEGEAAEGEAGKKGFFKKIFG